MRRFLALLITLSPLLVGCASNIIECPIIAPAPKPVKSFACINPDPKYKPQYLVFQGGGVKGVAYAGALQALEEQQILKDVRGVAGTSAGAITATLVALGYTPSEIHRLMVDEIDFSRFEDGGASGIFRIFRRYGYYKGDYFLNLMRCLVKEKTGKAHATFNDLNEDDKFLDLSLFATDLNTREIKELSHKKTGELEVALAARMSMSIPLVWAAVQHEGVVYVDGGVLDNYPIEIYAHDKGHPSNTLGFVLRDTKTAPKTADIDGFRSYSHALVETILNVQVAELQEDRRNMARTAVLDDNGVKTTDFHIDKDTKQKLIDEGASCTCSYLQERKDNPEAMKLLTIPLPPGENIPLSNFDKCGWVLDGPVGKVP